METRYLGLGICGALLDMAVGFARLAEGAETDGDIVRALCVDPVVQLMAASAGVAGVVRGVDAEHAEGTGNILTMLGLVRWARAGLPKVVYSGHKTAAALMVSSFEPDHLEQLGHPWPAWMLELPAGLLSMQGPRGEEVFLQRVLVVRSGERGDGRTWCYLAWPADAAHSMVMWRFGATPTTLANGEDERRDTGDPFLPLTAHDERVSLLLGRLIVATVLSLSSPDLHTRLNPKVHEAYEHHQRRADGTQWRTPRLHRVVAPVTIDLRDRVREYVSGRRRPGKSPEVRVLVRGHFKRQHHGPGNAQVKVIWREPFWRGPAGAPLVVRPHVVRGAE